MISARFPALRLRRLRQDPALRSLIRETHLSLDSLVYPLFIHHGKQVTQAIPSMPGCFQWSLDTLSQEIEELVKLNIKAVILFGLPAMKDPEGKAAYDNEGIIQTAIRQIKQWAPHLLVIADVCCCEYTDHGHCGLLSHDHLVVDNDATLLTLAEQAVSLARAGADILAPSGMMDGMIMTLRHALDQAQFSHLPLLSYSVKYCSALYGPFREAVASSPQFGTRETYQMDPANAREALREVTQDLTEGTDMIMVKPAGLYLDVIHRIKQTFPEIPLAAYQVSGEYSMIKAAATAGWLDEKRLALESLIAIKRAGADFIISYFAKWFAAIENDR